MTKASKKYYKTFIDDFSRYIKLCLIRNKDENFNIFLSYTTKIKKSIK